MVSKNLAVFVSGNGSNMQAIIDACEQKQINARVVAVICNNPHAFSIVRAKNHNIPVGMFNHRDYSLRTEHEQDINNYLQQFKIDLICLAGYMRILSPQFVKQFSGRIINIHPADNALHQGLHGYEWALESNLKETAVTVHWVDEGLDTGSVIIKKAVPIYFTDSVESLTGRGLVVEHQAYIAALKQIVGTP